MKPLRLHLHICGPNKLRFQKLYPIQQLRFSNSDSETPRIQKLRVVPIQQLHPVPIQQLHPVPIQQLHPVPIQQLHPVPIQQLHPVPIQQLHPVPIQQLHPVPIQQLHPVPHPFPCIEFLSRFPSHFLNFPPPKLCMQWYSSMHILPLHRVLLTVASLPPKTYMQ